MEWKAFPLRDPGFFGKRSLERRAAALIALLALEGPTPRSHLAGLLWPEVTETNARNNLRQTLRRLRQWSADVVIEGDTQLTLLTPLGEAEALALLAAHDYDDLPDLRDLLVANSERRRAAEIRRVWNDLGRARAEGDWRTALDLSAVLLDLDPLSEEAHRQAMRLHYLLGDRTGALAAYRRCQEVFQRELGVSPSAETQALASEIRRSTGEIPTGEGVLPLSVQRPPRLIGRDATWQQMERAWAEGKGVILSGVPGVGKTRLLRDFMTAHGQSVSFGARPGDQQVPYSTHARTYAALLRQYPGLALPEWVRRELARLLPALGEAPAPMASDGDKLRFYQAEAEVLRLAAEAGLSALAFDDLQFIDAASAEASEYSLSGFWGDEAARLHTIYAYRSGELSPELEARLQSLVSAGLAVHIPLLPLSVQEVDELLESLELPGVQAQSAQIALASGGNPLVVLESARHLLSQGGTGGTLSGRLPTLLGERLTRLSAAALNLARAAAVLGDDFAPEPAATMLSQTPLDLTAAWLELEAAQVLRGNAFTHDLLAEGVMGGLPAALLALLHRRAAAALEPAGQAPARLALHWEAGGEAARSAVWWLRAASEARAAYRQDDAVRFLRRAADLAERWNLRAAALEAYRGLHELLFKLDPENMLAAIHDRFLALASGPAEQAEVWHLRAQRAARLGQGDQAEAAARTGLALSELSSVLRADLLDDLVEALFAQNRVAEALKTSLELLPLVTELGEPGRLAAVHENIAVILDNFDRHAEAGVHHRQAAALAQAAGDSLGEIQVRLNLGISQAESGQITAVEPLDEALKLLAGTQGAEADYFRFLAQATRAIVLTELDRYAAAREALDAARTHLPAAGATPTMTAALHRYQARLALILGDARAAETHLGVLDTLSDLHPQQRSSGLLLRAELRRLQGSGALRLLSEAEALLGPEPRPIALGSVWLARIAALLLNAPEAALELAQRTCALAQLHAELPHLRVSAQTRAAQAFLALGRPWEARAQIEASLEGLKATYPADLEVSEVLHTHARVLAALGDPAALAALRTARAELLRVADQQVPPESRAAYLARPPHAELLMASQPAAELWRPLSDEQWRRVAGFAEDAPPGTGRPRRNSRAVLDGVLWALASGAAWNRPFPAHLPSASTCYRRYRAWNESGALTAALQELRRDPVTQALATRLLAALETSSSEGQSRTG